MNEPKLVYIASIISSGAKNIKDMDRNVQKSVEAYAQFIKGRGGNYVPFFPGLNNHELGKMLKWQWEDYMRMDIPILLRCDAVFFCKGWETSKGASMEHLIATAMNKEIIYEESYRYQEGEEVEK